MAKDNTKGKILCVGGSLDGRRLFAGGVELRRPVIEKRHVFYWDPRIGEFVMEYAEEIYEYKPIYENGEVRWEAHYSHKIQHLRPKNSLTFKEAKSLRWIRE